MKRITLFIISFILAYSYPIYILKAQRDVASVDELIESTKNDTTRVHVLLKLSKEYQSTAEPKGLDYGVNALVLANKMHYTKGIALANNNLGDFYWYKYDFESSELYYNEGFKLFKSLNDSAGIAEGYRNIGWIFYNRKEFIEALESHRNSLAINKQLQLKKQIGQNYNDVAICYKNLKLYDSALTNYFKALDIQNNLGNKNELSAVYENIGETYDEMNEQKLAIENTFLALKYAKAVNNKQYMTDIYSKLSNLYKKEENYDLAIDYIKLSTKAARQMDDKNMIKDNYKSLSELYALQKRFDKALYYNKLSSILLDSVHDEANARLETEMEQTNNLQNKLLAIKNLEKDKEITEQKLLQGKKIKLYLSGFGVIVAFFAVFLMRSNKQREKLNHYALKVHRLG